VPLDPLALARDLIRCRSVTPTEGGALSFLEQQLQAMGFVCQRQVFRAPGTEPVDNLYARLGSQGRNFCYAGHTDVVPPGDPADWSVDPFAGAVEDGWLIGRGAVDMKGSIACYLAALSRFLEKRQPTGSLSLLITADEEGPSINGTKPMLDHVLAAGERLDGCLVGEPTSVERVGDMAKIGRRGSLNGWLTVTGVQGHSAYPQLADNPAHRLVRLLHLMTEEPLDEGSAHFQPSTLQVTSIDIGNPAGNVIPAKATARFNVRFNDLHSGADVEAWVRRRMQRVGGSIALEVQASGDSFLTPPGPLSDAVSRAVEAVTGRPPELGTTGGTSDARFIKEACRVIELGLLNQWAHKVDEKTPVADLETLTAIYAGVLEQLAA